MTHKRKPPGGEYSAFRQLLDRVAKVPKAEIDERERQYQEREDEPAKPGAIVPTARKTGS